jgi:hypothetical protein
MSSRHKLLARICASYLIACMLVAGCLELVTAHYQAAVESAEDLQLDGILNRQVEDLAWSRYTAGVATLARDVSQEAQLRNCLERGDLVAFQASLKETWHRAAVTLGDISVLGVTVLRADGATITSEGDLSHTSSGTNIGALISQRQSVDRLRIFTEL